MNKIVVDERCSCSHFKSEHLSSIVSEGHGECSKCGCRKFTWSRYIYSDKTEGIFHFGREQ